MKRFRIVREIDNAHVELTEMHLSQMLMAMQDREASYQSSMRTSGPRMRAQLIAAAETCKEVIEAIREVMK